MESAHQIVSTSRVSSPSWGFSVSTFQPAHLALPLILLFLLCTAFAFPIRATAGSKTAFPDQNRSFDDADETRHVEIGGRVFSIPRRYFWGKLGATTGTARGVNLLVMLPDFQPYRSNNVSDPAICSGWCNQMHMAITESRTVGFRSSFVRELASWSSQKPLDYRAARKSYSGLKYLTLIDKERTSDWGVDVARGYHFDCSRPTAPHPSCTAYASIDEAIELRVTFSKNHVNELPNIIEKARNFSLRHQEPKNRKGAR